MKSEVGFDILLWGFDEPVAVNDYNKGEIYYNLSEFDEKDAIPIRVLGLEGYFADAVDSDEINNIKVKYPYVYHNLVIKAHPLSVRDDNDMELFYQVGKLNAKQYKYFALEGSKINRPYAILSKIPEGKAMLISDTSGFQPTFNYDKASRSFTISIRSFFPIKVTKID